jgi:hypothetical protein
MEMTQAIWNSLTPAQKDTVRDNSGLTPQLIGLEGWRVEVVDADGTRKRFQVGKSTGWRPCHLEISRRNAFGGFCASKSYASVRPLYKVEGL